MKPAYGTVACRGFLNDYAFTYSLLYESDGGGELVDYRRAVDKYYELVKHEGFKAEVVEFAKYRQDFVTSDRECAAFVLALKANGML